jgi:hypothetical protein
MITNPNITGLPNPTYTLDPLSPDNGPMDVSLSPYPDVPEGGAPEGGEQFDGDDDEKKDDDDDDGEDNGRGKDDEHTWALSPCGGPRPRLHWLPDLDPVNRGPMMMKPAAGLIGCGDHHPAMPGGGELVDGDDDKKDDDDDDYGEDNGWGKDGEYTW